VGVLLGEGREDVMVIREDDAHSTQWDDRKQQHTHKTINHHASKGAQ